MLDLDCETVCPQDMKKNDCEDEDVCEGSYHLANLVTCDTMQLSIV